jgi:hypothetical protein
MRVPKTVGSVQKASCYLSELHLPRLLPHCLEGLRGSVLAGVSKEGYNVLPSKKSLLGEEG